MCVCVLCVVRERECVCVRERERVCVCCERECERERESLSCESGCVDIAMFETFATAAFLELDYEVGQARARVCVCVLCVVCCVLCERVCVLSILLRVATTCTHMRL